MSTPPPFPTTVALELASTCPLRCRYCDRRNWKRHGVERRQPFLDEGLFYSLVAELAGIWPRPAVTLSFEGESTQHPAFPRLIASLADLGMRPWISTSLVGITDAALTALADHAGTVAVSLDGLEPSYRRSRGPDYTQVVAALERLLELCEARGSPAEVAVTMVTGSIAHPTDEALAFLAHWRPRVETAYLWGELDFGDRIRLRAPAGLERHLVRRRVCHQPFSFLAVLSDGSLCPCCTTSRVRFPGLHATQGLQAAFATPEYLAFLDRHRRLDLAGSPCSNCEGWIESCLASEELTLDLGLGPGEPRPTVEIDGLSLRMAGLRRPAGVATAAWQPIPSIGLGTRTGWAGGEPEGGLVETALCAGVTLFDTAPDYGAGHAEAALGKALQRAFEHSLASRDEVFLVTRAGRLPIPKSHRPTARDRSTSPEFCPPEGLLPGLRCFTNDWLQESIRRSLAALSVEHVDLLLLQEPEWLLAGRSAADRHIELLRLFTLLEKERTAGRIRAYGVASHVGLLSGPDQRLHLEVAELLEAAQRVGGKDHGLRAVAVPISFETLAAASSPRQHGIAGPCSLLEMVRASNLQLLAAAPFGRGRVLRSLPAGVIEEAGYRYTTAQWLVQLVRSIPGVSSCIIGTTSAAHLVEDLGILADAPWPESLLRRVLQ